MTWRIEFPSSPGGRYEPAASYDDGAVWAANVAADTPRHGRRELRIYVTGSHIETQTGAGVPLWSGPRVSTAESDHTQPRPEVASAALVPRDYGEEAVAMLSVARAFEWANGTGRPPEPRSGRVTISGEDADFEVEFDAGTGFVTRIASTSRLQRPIEITATWRRLGETPGKTD